MGLVSTAVFQKINDQTLLYSDLVLLQDQVNPVMSVALNYGLQIVSLHNLYLWDSPRVLLLNIKGDGNELQLAKAMREIFNKIKMTSEGKGDFPFGNFEIVKTTFDVHRIESILKTKGVLTKQIYRIEFDQSPMADEVTTGRVNTWAAFAGSDDEAVMHGSVALPEMQLQQALVLLRRANIYILAIHHHHLGSGSHDMISIHFWGTGRAARLAETLHTILLLREHGHESKNIQESLAISPPVLAGVNIPPVLLKQERPSVIVVNHSWFGQNHWATSLLANISEFRDQLLLQKTLLVVSIYEIKLELAHNIQENIKYCLEGSVAPSARALWARFVRVPVMVPAAAGVLPPVIQAEKPYLKPGEVTPSARALWGRLLASYHAEIKSYKNIDVLPGCFSLPVITIVMK
jgi:hypothetical protein